MWGFESLLPCQLLRRSQARGVGARPKKAEWSKDERTDVTQVTKVKNEEAQGGAPSFQMPGPIQRITEYPRRFRQFLHEVRVEMKQVTWPSRDDVVATTMVVIATVAFFGFYFFAVDGGVGYAVRQVYKLFKH